MVRRGPVGAADRPCHSRHRHLRCLPLLSLLPGRIAVSVQRDEAVIPGASISSERGQSHQVLPNSCQIHGCNRSSARQRHDSAVGSRAGNCGTSPFARPMTARNACRSDISAPWPAKHPSPLNESPGVCLTCTANRVPRSTCQHRLRRHGDPRRSSMSSRHVLDPVRILHGTRAIIADQSSCSGHVSFHRPRVARHRLPVRRAGPMGFQGRQGAG